MKDEIHAELQTARLLLRPLAASDAAVLVPALNDAFSARWLARVPHPYVPSDFADYLPRATPGMVWAIVDDQGFVGVIALNRAESGLMPRLRAPRPQRAKAKAAPDHALGMNA